MSFNENHIISIHNYEEWLVLYMDNELSAEQKRMVDDFLLLHPHLQEELALLLSTKLPEEAVVFSGKEELMASSMKLNTVDEELLLFIDNELSATESKRVEERIASDKDFRLQYQLLQKTKPDAAEVIPYPNKKELYRRAERRVIATVWMRIAAAVVLLLTGGYFFLLNQDTNTVLTGDVAVIEKPKEASIHIIPDSPAPERDIPQQQELLAKTTTADKTESKAVKVKLVPSTEEKEPESILSVAAPADGIVIRKQEAIRISLEKLTAHPSSAVNNSVANLPVTSAHPVTLNITEDPVEPAVTDGDNKPNHRTPAKGFLRKVSRFIERRTGIGTVNADNELLVGAVALKLN